MLEVKAGVVVAPGPSPSSNADLQAVAGVVIITVGQVEAAVAVLAVSRVVAVVGVGVGCEVVVPAQGLYVCKMLCNLCIRLFPAPSEQNRFFILLTPLYLSFSTCFEKSDSPECFLSPNPESVAVVVTGVADSFSSGPVSWRPLGVLEIK